MMLQSRGLMRKAALTALLLAVGVSALVLGLWLYEPLGSVWLQQALAFCS